MFRTGHAPVTNYSNNGMPNFFVILQILKRFFDLGCGTSISIPRSLYHCLRLMIRPKRRIVRKTEISTKHIDALLTLTSR
ncbi:hypothetical protein BKG76_05835 [Mycobacteroides franklinii]|uniref:Uncharacterized protein n=1 Tax=Mycobacteroides franklinii TaxID=948102 RepID=A0A1S1LE07_9MYCO|nr:hypothetical protein BKG76_05835 [Mycobacteroides franklinii]